MSLINDEIVDTLKNHPTSCEINGNSMKIITKFISNRETYARVDFIMHFSKDDSLASQMFISINPHCIHIIDFKSTDTKRGYGTGLLIFLNNTIKHFGLDIQFVTGTLSSKDYDHWDKLIHMYSTLISNKRMEIEQEYNAQSFLEEIHRYEDREAYFKIYL